MSTDAADSRSGSFLRIPFEAFLGFGLVIVVYSVAGLADIIESRMPAVVWFAAAAGACGNLVYQLGLFRNDQPRTDPTDAADSGDSSFYRGPA